MARTKKNVEEIVETTTEEVVEKETKTKAKAKAKKTVPKNDPIDITKVDPDADLRIEDFIPGMKRMHARLIFFAPILGTSPSDPDINTRFVVEKAKKKADFNVSDEKIAADNDMIENYRRKLTEDETIDDRIENGITVYLRDSEGRPCFAGYQIKGFFKEKCAALNMSDFRETLTAFRKKIDIGAFIEPDYPVIHDAGDIEVFQRPLRADTPQGQRVALSSSERIYPGAWTEFDIIYNNKELGNDIRAWLNYGCVSGTAQWRSAGFGRFFWEELDDDGNIIGGNYHEKTFKKFMAMTTAVNRRGSKV